MKRCISVCLLVVSSFFLTTLDVWAVGESDITTEGFKIHVGDFTPGGSEILDSTEGTQEVVQGTLGRILDMLLVVFGAAAVFMMTVGAWYMIIAHGQDELVSRGKSLFTGGIIALAVALSAGVIVQIFTYILY